MTIRTRTQLLNYISAYTDCGAVRRALTGNGTVEHLGLFMPDGWIVKIISPNKTTWYSIVKPVTHGCFSIYTPYTDGYEPPWKNWQGECESENTLYTGDDPKIYKELRDESISSL